MFSVAFLFAGIAREIQTPSSAAQAESDQQTSCLLNLFDDLTILCFQERDIFFQ